MGSSIAASYGHGVTMELVAERLVASGEDPSLSRISDVMGVVNSTYSFGSAPAVVQDALLVGAIACVDALDTARASGTPTTSVGAPPARAPGGFVLDEITKEFRCTLQPDNRATITVAKAPFAAEGVLVSKDVLREVSRHVISQEVFVRFTVPTWDAAFEVARALQGPVRFEHEKDLDQASMFRFEVDGAPCKSVEDALNAARKLIHISPDDEVRHAKLLREGNSTTVAYGFSQVGIDAIPVPLNKNHRLAMKALSGVENRLWEAMLDAGHPDWIKKGAVSDPVDAQRCLLLIPESEIAGLLDHPFANVSASAPAGDPFYSVHESDEDNELCL